MADRSNSRPRSLRLPQQPQSRKRWAATAGIVTLWAILAYGAGSAVAGTVLLVLLAVAVVLVMVALRSLGINRDHPWLPGLAARPGRDAGEPAAPAGWPDVSGPAPPVWWRDVREPAPSAVRRDVSGAAPPAVWRDVSAPAGPAGGYRLDQGQPMGPPPAAGSAAAYAREGGSYVDPAAARTVVSEFVTVAAAAPVPVLRLVTNGAASETRASAARAGRGRETELRLPDEPTVSRVHAEFTFTDGRWHVINLGLNGVTLNGTPLNGTHPVTDGDSIGWGTQPGALTSRVEVGWDRARQPDAPQR